MHDGVRVDQLLKLEYGAALPDHLRKLGAILVVGSSGIVGLHDKALVSGPGIVVGRKGSVGKVTWIDGDYWPIDTTYYVVVRNDVNVGWAFRVLQHLPLDRLDASTGVPGLNRNDVYRLNLEFLPTADEQSAIADVLDAIEDAIRESKSLIDKLKLVRTGLIDDALSFGSEEIERGDWLVEKYFGKHPQGWSVELVGALLQAAEYGVSVSLDEDPGVPVLRMNNIQDGEFDLTDMKYAPPKAVSHLRLVRGDVLYNRTNSIEHVGKAAIWRSDETGPAFASYLVRLVPGERLRAGFLHMWLNWAPVQRALRRFATPGVQQVNINPTNLKRVPIAFPNDPDEQSEIVQRVDQVRKRIDTEQGRLLKLSALRDGLRDDLLSGRVRIGKTNMEAVA